jgi:hypothetical protein
MIHFFKFASIMMTLMISASMIAHQTDLSVGGLFQILSFYVLTIVVFMLYIYEELNSTE